MWNKEDSSFHSLFGQNFFVTYLAYKQGMPRITDFSSDIVQSEVNAILFVMWKMVQQKIIWRISLISF